VDHFVSSVGRGSAYAAAFLTLIIAAPLVQPQFGSNRCGCACAAVVCCGFAWAAAVLVVIGVPIGGTRGRPGCEFQMWFLIFMSPEHTSDC